MTWLPWLVGGAVLLLAGLGTALVVWLSGDGGGTEPEALQAPETTEAPTAGTTAPLPRAPRATVDLPGGARDAAPAPADSGRYAGSADAALAWVEAMGRQDFQTAYDLSCAEVQESAATAADGGSPADALGDYFYAVTLGGQDFSSGTLDGVEHQPDSGTDLASFTLQLADGESFLLLVYVGPDLAVCDFY